MHLHGGSCPSTTFKDKAPGPHLFESLVNVSLITDMKVLHEHTGIGRRHTPSSDQNKWHWSVVGNRTLLTHQHMHRSDAGMPLCTL